MMENDRFKSLLPSNNQLLLRADVCKNYEEKFKNREEDHAKCYDFYNISESEEVDEDEENTSDDESFVEEPKIESRALVDFNPKELFERRLLPLIKKKQDSLTEEIGRMEFHGKVSDWLKNNTQHMAEPIFLDNNTLQFPGNFRMRQFNSTEMGFDHSNASSVNTAANLLCFERDHPWRPIEIQDINEGGYPSIRAPRKRLSIEYPQQCEESPLKNRSITRLQRKQKRLKPSPFESSDYEEKSTNLKNQKKTPQKKKGRSQKSKNKAPDKDISKKQTPDPTEIVVYKPDKPGYKWNEDVQVTFEMLAAKIGRKDAESLKNHPFLRYTMPAASTLVYNVTNKRLKELMSRTRDISSDSEETDEDILLPIINHERRESVQEDVVIYKPSESKLKSRATIRITVEMLRKKLDKKTFESLIDTPFLKFPFPEASTLLLNCRTKKLYEKFA